MKIKDFKRFAARFAVIALVFALAFATCGCSTQDLDNQTGNSTDKKNTDFVYVILGDGVAYGYGLGGDKSISPNEILKKGSYPQLFSAELEKNYTNVRACNLSHPTNTSAEVLEQLNEADVQATIKEASVITLSVGLNDILQAVQNAINNSMYDKDNPPILIDGFAQFLVDKEIKDSLLSGLSESLGAEGGNEKAMLQAAENAFELNISAIVTKIHELNPNAVLIVNNQYLPYSGLNQYGDAVTICNLGVITDIYYKAMNSDLTTLKQRCDDNGWKVGFVDLSKLTIDSNDKYTNKYINVKYDKSGFNIRSLENDLDPHPNAAGHIEIANAVIAEYKKLA